MVGDDRSLPVEASRIGPRFQFSLATLMLLVTAFSVYCGLAAWLGSWMIVVVPVLAVGPVGGTIIVRARKSEHFGDVALWSGLITMTMWAFVFGDVDPSATLALAPVAMMVGVTTGLAWEVTARMLKRLDERLNPAQDPDAAGDGEV